MKQVLIIVLISFTLSTNAQTTKIISHIDKSGVIVGSNNNMTVTNKTVVNQFQPQKYNKIWVQAIRKTIDEKYEMGNKRLDSIENILLKILTIVENVPKATELAKETLQKQSIQINNEKFNSLTQEINLLEKDGDFTKYGNEYVFDPIPTVKKGELAFASDFLTSSLVALKKNNNYGFINNKGELIIPYKYDYAYPFYENLAVVKKNFKWQVINISDKKVFEFDDYYDQIDSVFQINNMLLPFTSRVYSKATDERVIYLRIYNLKDSTTTAFRLKGSNYLSDGKEIAKQDIINIVEGKILVTARFFGPLLIVADYNGNILDEINYSSFSVSKTSQIVSIERKKLWGFYDLRTKTEIIAPMYKWVENFIFDYSIVMTTDGRFGIIDKNNHSYVNLGDWKIERTNNNLLKFTSLNRKLFKKGTSFITDASLNCITGNCQTTD